jgi:hypothetical protein
MRNQNNETVNSHVQMEQLLYIKCMFAGSSEILSFCVTEKAKRRPEALW